MGSCALQPGCLAPPSPRPLPMSVSAELIVTLVQELLTGLCSLGGHGSSSSKAGVQSLQLCVRTQALQEDQDPSRPQARDPPAAVPEPVPNGVHQPFPEAAPNEAPEENGAETVRFSLRQPPGRDSLSAPRSRCEYGSEYSAGCMLTGLRRVTLR